MNIYLTYLSNRNINHHAHEVDLDDLNIGLVDQNDITHLWMVYAWAFMSANEPIDKRTIKLIKLELAILINQISWLVKCIVFHLRGQIFKAFGVFKQKLFDQPQLFYRLQIGQMLLTGVANCLFIKLLWLNWLLFDPPKIIIDDYCDVNIRIRQICF